ncbi:RNA polymerase sigma factor [Methylomonas koyamae]|uniref:RNA polymerase sigma factor n=1 Tax=Methylomonas koyamae TaxID=702114 RepID=UPI00112DCD96|nr:sigma-70 family RNA polymerase sigma factor [Methylomonas koyamae]TPQ24197.1 RNA polymerase subunit sigma-24 [Methylomonas koyamae]
MSLDIAVLYRSYRKELQHHLQRIVHCPETAQDLVQESYLILCRNAADTIEHPRGLLYRIAGNLALDHLRHGRIVDRHRETCDAPETDRYPDAESQVADAQRRALLHQSIAELPPRCRDAFILNKLRGMSYRDIALLLDISESAVEKHVIKGVTYCRKRLGGQIRRWEALATPRVSGSKHLVA